MGRFWRLTSIEQKLRRLSLLSHLCRPFAFCSKWDQCHPLELFEAPVLSKVPPRHDGIATALTTEARKAQASASSCDVDLNCGV